MTARSAPLTMSASNLAMGAGAFGVAALVLAVVIGPLALLSVLPVAAITVVFVETPISARWRTIIIGAGIFSFAFLGYYFVGLLLQQFDPSLQNDKPVNWLNFYTYLAEAITKGSLDLRDAGLTGQEHPDLLVKDGHVYLPYGPTPALLLIPSVLIFGLDDTAQWVHAMIVGAINVVLFWYILRLLEVSRTTKLLLVPFFAFGTANFYAATTGTLWFYNHVTAVMFLLIAIIFLLRGSHSIVPAIFLGLALLARQPALLAAPAFMYLMIRQRHSSFVEWGGMFQGLGLTLSAPLDVGRRLFRRVTEAEWLRDRQTLERLGLFVAALVPFILIYFWYNAVRFGSPFDTGLDEIYGKYAGQVYTLYLKENLSDRFAEFDLRNVPLHLYTIFLLPPTFAAPPFLPAEQYHNSTWIRPSEYGMSVVLTSSPFIYAFFANRKPELRIACWLAIPLVAIPTLVYYSQGWVQFGYRYLMDYLPFIMILTALGFEQFHTPKSLWIKVALVVLSIAIGFWGRYWGTRLGW